MGSPHPVDVRGGHPVAVSYLLLWNPPKGWDQGALVAYLVATAVLIRSFISCYENPVQQRSPPKLTPIRRVARRCTAQVLSAAYLFGAIGGAAECLTYWRLALARLILNVRPKNNAVGQLNPEG
jgi:GPH family glycoside/pentoside/hexuronide:cation symporter